MKVILGEEYQDDVTGYQGIATARTEYVKGTPRVQLEHLIDDGLLDEQWFDEGRLSRVEDES